MHLYIFFALWGREPARTARAPCVVFAFWDCCVQVSRGPSCTSRKNSTGASASLPPSVQSPAGHAARHGGGGGAGAAHSSSPFPIVATCPLPRAPASPPPSRTGPPPPVRHRAPTRRRGTPPPSHQRLSLRSGQPGDRVDSPVAPAAHGSNFGGGRAPPRLTTAATDGAVGTGGGDGWQRRRPPQRSHPSREGRDRGGQAAEVGTVSEGAPPRKPSERHQPGMPTA